MNYFFGFKTNEYNTSLTIPKFSNYKNLDDNVTLYSAKIKNNRWVFDQCAHDENKNFFYLDSELVNNDNFFFLSTPQEIDKQLLSDKLINLNNYTNTYPDYRCNLEVNKKNAGFSSYQSEYPYSMTNVKGSVVSSISVLTHNDYKNYLIFKNIYSSPIVENFKGYILDLKKEKILKEIDLFTNKTNVIELESDWIKKSSYFCSKNYVGVPVFLIDDQGHLSFEHTLALQSYTLADKNVSKVYKQKILSIIE